RLGSRSLVSVLRSVLLYSYGALRDLPSFPTRRSSDLPECRRRARSSGGSRPRGGADRGRPPDHLGRHAVHRVTLAPPRPQIKHRDRKSTRLNSSHVKTSYAVFCLKKKKSGYSPSKSGA